MAVARERITSGETGKIVISVEYWEKSENPQRMEEGISGVDGAQYAVLDGTKVVLNAGRLSI